MPSDIHVNGRGFVLLDTSAALSLLLEDHEAHDVTLAALKDLRLGLAGHAWFETFSVLTRLPAGLRRSPGDAFRLLEHNFPESRFLGEIESTSLASELGRLRVSGGAVYDALVGAAARHHQARLASRDARARPTYTALGVQIQELS
jgi:predicted nucleic acid-binding protein